MRAAAGRGWHIAEGDEHEAERWPVSRQRIYDLIGVWLEPGDEAIYIEGLSMKRPGGGLDDGQLVLYRPTDHVVSGQRFVLQVESLDTSEFVLLCKRVQILASGAIRLISDNRAPGFSDETLLPVKDQEHMIHAETSTRVRLHVIGRVLWPREEDEEREIRLITQTLRQLSASGMLAGNAPLS